MEINAGTLRVLVDCEPAILREIVSLALAGLPGIVLLGAGGVDADVVVASTPRPGVAGRALVLLHESGGLGRLVDSIRRLLPDGELGGSSS